jgi:acetylornithine deacetylase/succinyl-diaminopimelate desuccinylase-like protein
MSRSQATRGATVSAEELAPVVAGLMDRAKADLAELVAFKSVADPKQYPPEECEKAARWVVDAFAEVGLEDVAMSPTPDGSMAVHGHVPGPDGSPTVLLYSHYDVQPPNGEDDWTSPVWELTERDGRWYGRGAADCKGPVVMHLTALRALEQIHGGFPCTVKLICEGSEEMATGGLERFVPAHADLLRADAILIADTGNFAVGVPTLTTALRGSTSVDVKLDALRTAVHSGKYGGAAPDPVMGLIQMLSSLHDEHGNTTIDGLDATQTWSGVAYPDEQFRADAEVLEGVELIGDGAVADRLWARPAATVIGIDAPDVVGAPNAVQPSATARVSLRVPPGMTGEEAQDALVAHLQARVPRRMRCNIEPVGIGDPFVGSLDGPAFEAMRSAMEQAYGRPLATKGTGGSIPLCNVLAETYPDAEIMLYGVQEPRCLIHAPDESVDPSELERIALAEALFLGAYAEKPQ